MFSSDEVQDILNSQSLSGNVMTFTVSAPKDFINTVRYWDLQITKVIWNDNAVIVFWSDKTKTVVKKMDSDNDDIYAAVAQALAKKVYCGTGNFHTKVDKVLQDHRSGVDISSAMKMITSSFGKFFNGIWEITHRDFTFPEDK